MDLLDRNELVRDEDAFFHLKELAEKEAILAGISSGAVVFKSVELANEMESGTIVTVFPDGAWKYLSDSKHDKHGRQYGYHPLKKSDKLTGALL